MATINFNWQGIEHLDALRYLMTTMRNRVALMRQIGTRLDKWIDENFAAEGLEQKWRPLAASTVFARRAGSSKVLQDNGRLRASHTFVATPDKVVIGFPEGSKAEYHHWGSPAHTIKARAGKVLAFPFPPFSRMATYAERTSIRRRPKGSPNIGAVSIAAAKRAGLRMPPGKGKVQSMLFTRSVHHPGLVARPLLPSLPLAETLVTEVMNDYVDDMVKKASKTINL